jgi:hypothetical protein
LAPHIEDADLERCRHVRVLKKRGHLFLLAGVERASDDPPARGLDLGDQRRQLLAAPPGEDGEPLDREFSWQWAAPI